MNRLVIYFGQNEKKPLSGEMHKLEPLVSVIACPGTTATISGHASSEGSDPHNMSLSRERAEFVEAYLIAMGAQARQLKGFKGQAGLPPGQMKRPQSMTVLLPLSRRESPD